MAEGKEIFCKFSFSLSADKSTVLPADASLSWFCLSMKLQYVPLSEKLWFDSFLFFFRKYKLYFNAIVLQLAGEGKETHIHDWKW